MAWQSQSADCSLQTNELLTRADHRHLACKSFVSCNLHRVTPCALLVSSLSLESGHLRAAPSTPPPALHLALSDQPTSAFNSKWGTPCCNYMQVSAQYSAVRDEAHSRCKQSERASERCRLVPGRHRSPKYPHTRRSSRWCTSPKRSVLGRAFKCYIWRLVSSQHHLYSDRDRRGVDERRISQSNIFTIRTCTCSRLSFRTLLLVVATFDLNDVEEFV